MKLFKHIYVFLFFVFLLSEPGFTRDKRVNQIPNGPKFGCNNCHFGRGGSRNPFGLQIQGAYLTEPNSNGDVMWGPALAVADADSDGATNGTELLDPGGAWNIGDASPGELSLVSNPGDPLSVTLIRNQSDILPGTFDLKQNYPNPFNPKTTINFDIAESGHVGLYIYNINGQVVRTLIEEFLTPGQYIADWNGLDRQNRQLVSGIYYYKLVTDSFSKTKTMILLK